MNECIKSVLIICWLWNWQRSVGIEECQNIDKWLPAARMSIMQHGSFEDNQSTNDLPTFTVS